ncbi:MAG TPA: CPBP family intramembrane glutamic endopeptidase [Rhizomicrobium sp.]
MPVPTIAAILLGVFAAALGWFVYSDKAEYARFKALTESRDRQARFVVWIAKSFLLFGGGAVVGLALVGHRDALVGLPPEFEPVLKLLSVAPDDRRDLGSLFEGFLIALPVALLTAWLILRRRAKSGAGGPIALGDIQPLLPRNGAERLCAVFLALNAGLSEELFFRLALPLLLALVFGNAVAAFAVAAVVFGIVHLYQGWIGVLATTVLGAVFTMVYLGTGSIWLAAALHALIDINGLIVMPLLTRGARA